MYIKRRDFLRATFGTAAALGTRWPLLSAAQRSAADVVLLGPDKVRLSRLATGLGTISGSVQRKLGVQGLADYLRFGFDQGITYWDTAGAYGTHAHVNEALKSVPREKVAIMSKARATTAEQMK